jgi:Flp pilus assembly protein TadD
MAPEEPSYWEPLARVQLDRDEPGEAIRCWARVMALAPTETARTHIGLGSALQEEGRLSEARAHYERAAQLEPGSAGALVHLGGVHAETGQMAEAEAAFRAAARLKPRAAQPLSRLATLLRHRLPESDRAAIEDLLADPRLGPKARARLLFGLAHLRDARGEYDHAAGCLREANALTLAEARGAGAYSPADHTLHVDGLLGAFDAAFFARTAGMGDPTRRPVFDFGQPRSGTTLVEQVLASHPQVQRAGELRLGRRSFEAVPAILGRRARPVECVAHLDAEAIRLLAGPHLAALAALDGGRADRIVDKMPDNYLYLGLLAALFPNAAFLHCRRDLRDVAVSCWMTDFRTIRWANDPMHIASRFHEYRRLINQWAAVLPVVVHEVDYETTVADLEGVARRLLAACGLEWNAACLEFHRTERTVRTASLAQVRRPIYTTSVARWKHYETALADLFAALPDEAARPA